MRKLARVLAAVLVIGAGAVATGIPAAGQEAPADEETFELPQTYLDGYGWWTKAEQNPIGGQNPGLPADDPTCQPTDTNECPAGPPADGIYIVYDYESVPNQSVVTGPIQNAPLPGTPETEEPAPTVSEPTVLGPTAYGAVRYIVPEGAETQLSIPILSRSSSQPGGTDPTVGKLFACVVTTPGWAPAQAGRYDQGPKYDCTTADEADVSGDTAIFDLGTVFVSGTTLDLAIVGAGDRAFQMALGPPTDASLAVTSAPESETFVLDETFEDPITEFSESSEFVAPALAPEVAFTDEFASAPVVPVARPQRQQAVTAGRIVNPFSPDASRGERMMAVALLLLIAFGLWWVGGREARAPRLLGSLGAAQVAVTDAAGSGGIGRFRRPRHGSAPRLF